MSQLKLPSISSYLDENEIEILQSKLMGGRALGRVMDLLSSYIRNKGFPENQSFLCASQMAQLCMEVLTNTSLTSNILTIEFAISGNEFWFGIRGTLSPIKSPVDLKNQVNQILIPDLSDKHEYVVHVRKLVCSWICSIRLDEKFGTHREVKKEWTWNLTNQVWEEEKANWKNLGDYNTEQWVKEVGRLKGDTKDAVTVDGSLIHVVGNQEDAASVDAKIFNIKGDASHSAHVEKTEIRVEGNKEHAAVLNSVQTVFAGDAALIATLDTTVVFDQGVVKNSDVEKLEIDANSDVDDEDTVSSIQDSSPPPEEQEKISALIKINEKESKETTDEINKLSLSVSNETDVEKLKQNFSRLVHVLENERGKVAVLSERVITAEREANAFKPKAKELESKLERAANQILQRKKEVDQVKVKLKQAEQEKNKVDNELRNAKAQIATISKRLVG